MRYPPLPIFFDLIALKKLSNEWKYYTPTRKFMYTLNVKKAIRGWKRTKEVHFI